MALFEQVHQSIQLGAEKKNELSQAIKDGYVFYEQFNNSRMELAFSLFTEDMKKALFEVIFFLNVNDPKFEEHKYMSTRIEKVYGVPKEVEYEATTSLYVENAPAGVVGIANLSSLFRNQFEKFIHTELDTIIVEETGFAPIYSIASLGSIGTIGHKATASDLDLQVQYELEPFLIDPAELTDETLDKYANELVDFFSKKYRLLKKYSKKALQDKKLRSQIVIAGRKNFKKRFPLLYDVVLKKNGNIRKSVLNNSKSKQLFAHEIINMAKLYSKIYAKRGRSEREQLLKQKIRNVQDYVQKKYPKAEIYIFAYSNDDYRNGKHGTTLESKEASGSAYELILNYEILMPGIQFTPMIPTHFLMPPSINASRSEYEQFIDYIRFHCVEFYDQYRDRLVDLGSTPPLTPDYLTAHSGAVYWEAFKASSGNLPKATINLLRFEMQFDQRFNTSAIELIKNPHKLDRYAGGDANRSREDEVATDEGYLDEEEEDDFYDDYGIENPEQEEKEDVEVLGEEDTSGGMPLDQVFYIEDKFPKLRQDPWWLRYKATKIGFGPMNEMVTDERERDLISRIIDFGYALHIRVSDVFSHIKESKKLETYREKVLGLFLEKAFPKSKRRILEHISNGETDAVISFEKDLKFLFKRSMKRVQQYVDNYGGKDKTNQDENRIWYHYYETHFDPPRNVVRRDILGHLKVPRGRLQIGINDKRRWFFRSIQKSTLAESRYDTFGQLDHLPDEVDLFEHESFLHGIAHCILNGYYGVLNKGTLKESRTHLEYSVGHTEIGKASADKWAYIRPDIVDRLVDNIDRAFPLQEYDFRDCIYKDKEIENMFICLNLLEYGRVSFMYRDNLKSWYVDEVDHPKVERQAREMYQSQELLFDSPEIQKTIKDFFTKHSVKIDETTKANIWFWINPNSVHTHHHADKFSQKEKELAQEFREMIFDAISSM